MNLENNTKSDDAPAAKPISGKKIKHTLMLVRRSRKFPFPPSSALMRIGRQIEAAHRDYKRQKSEYEDVYFALELALKAEDETQKTLHARDLLEIDELIELNAVRVVEQGVHLAHLMGKMLDACEREIEECV